MFSPTGNSHEHLQANGCEVALGKDTWHQPGGNHEPEMISMAQGAAALAGPVTVSDSKLIGGFATCPAVNTVGNGDGNLDPGESITCTGTYTVTATDVTNGFVTNLLKERLELTFFQGLDQFGISGTDTQFIDRNR